MLRTIAIVAAVSALCLTAAEAQVRYLPKPHVSWSGRASTPHVGVRFGSRGTTVRYSTPTFGIRSGPRGTSVRFSSPGVSVRSTNRRTSVRYATPRRAYTSPRRTYTTPRRTTYVAPRRYVRPQRTVVVRPQRTVVVRPQRTVVVRPQRTVVVDPCPPTVVQRQRTVFVPPAEPEPSSVRVDMTDPSWDPAPAGGFERHVTVGNQTTRLPNTTQVPNTIRVGTGRSTQPRTSVDTGRTRSTTWVSTGRSNRARTFDTGRRTSLEAPQPRALARALLAALDAGDGDRACALARWLEVRPDLWDTVEVALYAELPSPTLLRSARRDLARDCQGTAGCATLLRLLGAR